MKVYKETVKFEGVDHSIGDGIMSDDRRVVDSRWFNDVGVVRVWDRFDGHRYFIGSTVEGNFMYQDEERIMKWGTKFPLDAGDALFGIK